MRIGTGIRFGTGINISQSVAPPASGSVFFPNATSYLKAASTITLGVACTFECWFYPVANPATNKIMLVGGGGNRGLSIYNGTYGQSNYSATKWTVDWETAGNIEFTVPTMTAGAWYHLAMVQNSSGVTTIWLNGTRSSTGTITPNWNFQAQLYGVGRWTTQSIGSQGGLYISNLRMTTTNVYTPTQTSITVPTTPLSKIAGTQLLLNTATSATAYTDSSDNAITMNAFGTTAWNALKPF